MKDAVHVILILLSIFGGLTEFHESCNKTSICFALKTVDFIIFYGYSPQNITIFDIITERRGINKISMGFLSPEMKLTVVAIIQQSGVLFCFVFSNWDVIDRWHYISFGCTILISFNWEVLRKRKWAVSSAGYAQGLRSAVPWSGRGNAEATSSRARRSLKCTRNPGLTRGLLVLFAFAKNDHPR